MNLNQFLSVILPTAGNYYTVQITSTGTIRQYKHTTVAEAEASLHAIAARHHNAYIATGSFGEKRTQAACKHKRVWYVDIDCKPGGNYETMDEGMDAIKAALKDGLIPPTIIVVSGNGYHLYWVCTEDVASTDWKSYAKAIANACKKHNLNVDTACTADEARILRAPETLNYKDPKNPKLCRVLAHFPKKFYSFKNIADRLNPYLTGPAPAAVPLVDNSDLFGGVVMNKPSSAAMMIEQCPVFKNSEQTHGANDSEPLWHKIIHTLAYCDDGADFIHPLSDQHPGYSQGKTERKFTFSHQKKASGEGGPSLCDTFDGLSSECASCQWRGQIKSPIKLAFGKPSELPFPWRLGDNCVEKSSEDGWEKVIRYPVSKFEAVLGHDDTHVSFKIGPVSIYTTLDKLTSDNRSLQVVLSKKGVSLDTYELEEMRRLVNAWMHQLNNAKQSTKGVGSFGWVRDGEFHYAGTIYSKAGTEQTQIGDRGLTEIFSPEGALEPWQACANHILSQPRYASWAVIASAFAAPLLKFTNVTGAVLSIVSQDTGTGKSTAMKIAQGAWGNPKSGMASLDDTPNSVANRLGKLNNLPAYWDEVREKEHVQRFISNVFRLSQGREKTRLTSNIEQRAAGEWATIMTIASNEPLKDHILQTIGNSDAGTARVFELRAHAIGNDGLNDGAARHFYGQLDKNYGHAGLAYAEWLGSNPDLAEAKVKNVDEKLSTKFKTGQDERFWVATISALIAGAQIATDLGICQFDMPAFRKYLLTTFKGMRAGKAQEYTTPLDRAMGELQRYLHTKTEYIIKAERLPGKGGRGGGTGNAILMDSLRQPAVARIGTKQHKIRIMLDDFQEWYYDRSGSGYSHVVENLITAGAKRARGSIDAGTPNSVGGRHRCLDIPYHPGSPLSALGMEVSDTDNSDLGQ